MILFCCEICGVWDRISHYLLIRDDDRGSRLDLVSELLRKLGVESDSRSQILRLNGTAFATHAHPSARLASGRKLTRFTATAFEQCKYVTTETTSTTNLNRRASDGVAIAINVQRTIGGA
jgi:hypothetical protein